MEWFLRLVNRESRGVAATLLRCGLSLAEVPYAAAMSLRNTLYDSGILTSRHAGVPTISVGNLTLGGTGKSPLVAWLVAWSLEASHTPAVISRGYSSESNHGTNDEARELALQFPSLVQRHGADRLRVAAALLQDSKDVDLLILDDAFQHRRIRRDIDVVLIDATNPFGCEHIFPRGLLREPVAALRRADVVVLSRATMIDAAKRRQIANRVLAINPNVLWCEASHRPATGVAETLRGRRVVAFCGIGNPNGFRHTLKECGAIVGELIAFPDHHQFTPRDLDRLSNLASDHTATLVCTMKDHVKLPDNFDVTSVPIELDIITGEPELRKLLAKFTV